MALVGSTNEQKIWNFLFSHLNNAFGVSGIMGNMYAESGLAPTNLQQTYEVKLGYTDQSYTDAVDSGKYNNFIYDSAGYGVCQWTYWSRKQDLLNYAKSKGVSIGNLEMQLEFLIKELTSYGLLNTLKVVKSVKEASNIILLQFEKPASKDTEATQTKRANYSQTYYDKYANQSASTETSTSNQGGKTMSNSSLVSYTKISPNRTSPRNHIIDRVTIHCVVGQCSVEMLGAVFAPTSRQASCNYGIGSDGRIALICEEKDRSWCTSSGANDHRAITIEVASDTTHPYAVNDKAYEATIKLVADICRRNGKKRITWLADKEKSINYAPAADEMLMTVHRWFANKACPGDYLYSRHYDIANRVNALLGNTSTSAPVTTTPPTTKPATNTSSTKPKQVTATKAAQEKDSSLAGAYTVTANDGLHCRNGAGTQFASLVVIPYGTQVRNYGYYTVSKGVKWLYIQFTLNGTTYTGFSSSAYLRKA